MVRAIVGACWGDEGKGKITDALAANADVVIRFQGGANAGHTIVNEHGKFALHLLPSGIFHPDVTNVIGPGVAVDVDRFIAEKADLNARGIQLPNLMISDRAQVVMPYHVLFDQLQEAHLGGKSYGSTKSGIAPFYADKFAKKGFQIAELYAGEAYIKDKLKTVLEEKNILLQHLYHVEPLEVEAIYSKIESWKEALAPFVRDVTLYLDEAIKANKTLLLEGQLGSLKDPDHGIYPMVTSSSTLAAYGAIGAGIPPYEIKEITTVVKAYSSAVGAGAFVSEIFGEEASLLREHGGSGGEYGATTGRPRRVGWFDCVASRYGCRLQGTTEVAFTVVDSLGYLEEIPVCVAYEIDGEICHDFPVTPKLEKAKPILKTLPGWHCDIQSIRRYEDLPEACRNYIEFIEKEIGYPIRFVSNGPDRENLIRR